MPDLQTSPVTAAGLSPALLDGARRLWTADNDDALGCECAHPCLQIECWQQECSGPPPELNS